MAYSSRLDLKIGEVPNTTNYEIFPDMVDIYNAIHILGQYVNTVISGTNPDDNGDTSTQMDFDHAFWVRSVVNVTAGQVVHCTGGGLYHGVNHSVTPIGGSGEFPNMSVYGGGASPSFAWGIALSDAASGERARVGIGPVIIKMDSVNIGDAIYAACGFDVKYIPFVPLVGLKITGNRLAYDGNLYRNVTNDTSSQYPTYERWARGYVQIGYAVEDGAVLILGPGMTNFATRVRNIEWA